MYIFANKNPYLLYVKNTNNLFVLFGQKLSLSALLFFFLILGKPNIKIIS